MGKSLFIAYTIGMLTMFILATLTVVFPFLCFKHRNFSKCSKCNVISCPHSGLWKESEHEPRGLFRFSLILIFGSTFTLAAFFLSSFWFLLICLTLAA